MSRLEATKRFLRGEPLGVPSHAMVVHFPAALLPMSLLFDLISRLSSIDLGPGSLALLGFGLLGGIVAAGTGLLDWVDMIPGTPRHARVTRHLVVQSAGLLFFVLGLGLRLLENAERAPDAAVAASAVGTALLLFGNHLGGLLVYRDGLRVRSSR